MVAEAFWGTWRLVRFEARTAGGEVSHPMGEDAAGYLLYGEDGYMAATVMRAGRGKFRSAEIAGASAEEKVAAFDSYSTYCGTYEVLADKVIHRVQCSLLPNWSGTDQERFFEFAEGGERLTLRTKPMLALGVEQTLVVIWERVRP